MAGVPWQGLSQYGAVRMRAAGTIVKGDFVQLGTNGVVAGADGTSCFGIASEAAVTGDYFTVYVQGIFAVTCAAAYNPANGDPVYLASASTVDGGAITNLQVGVVTYDDPASAGTAYILLTPAQATYFAHA